MNRKPQQSARTLEIDLCGPWRLADGAAASADAEGYPATVPGCVHTDLLDADVIPDPWYRDQEKDIHWVWKRDWIYTRSFEADAEVLSREMIDLRCDGLDTLATITVNGQEIGVTDNMFRRWAFDIKPYLRAGANEIAILFASPAALMARRDGEKRLPGWNLFHTDFQGKSYLRKMACAFGWDWGLMAPTAGIWRPIRVVAADGRLDGLRVGQEHRDGRVTLEVSGEVIGRGARVRLSVARAGEGEPVLARCICDVSGSAFAESLEIEEPALWWPNQMGDQPLYVVTAELLGEGGAALDHDSRRIGLRTVELIQEPDAHGVSFRFRINGRDIFAKGANWIPCDVFPSRISDDTYHGLLESAAESGMNMIRVWGGGIYEDARFYEGCDDLGILVWQDFMFACSTYPTFDPDFMAGVKAEALDNIKRLRHHPCLALWCGNNEMEQGLVDDSWADRAMSWSDYKPLFDDLLAEVVAEADGATPYWPCSPHTPEVDVEGNAHDRRDFNDATVGDAHSWSVWFGGKSFEDQRAWMFRFMSEFGFQSFPEPRTVESYTDPEDRRLTGWIMDYHQRSGPGNQTIFKYMLEWFCPPKDFESTLWLTQITQALCIEYASDHARRIQGRMDGLLYWQLNDLWPGATWSSIDVYGRWKALQYFAKRFFAPVRVSILESIEDGVATVYVSNHGPGRMELAARWSVMTGGGEIVLEGGGPVSVGSQDCVEVKAIACQPFREGGGADKLPLEVKRNPHATMAGDRDIFVCAWVTDADGVELSRTLAMFAKPKHLLLREPEITVRVTGVTPGGGDGEEGGAVVLSLASDVPAPWTRLEITGSDERPSDNFIHLFPGQEARVTIPAKAFAAGSSKAAIVDRVKTDPLIKLWS